MKIRNVVIDTNALISFVTDRDHNQQAKVAWLLENAAKLHFTIFCPLNVITEFVYVLLNIYRVPKTTVKQMVSDFIVMPGVEIVTDLDFEIFFSIWPDHVSDYGDAIVAAVCKTKKGAYVATFDRKFRKDLEKLGVRVYNFSQPS
ncbi:MAG: type II toxin-antitoxin system VapC family toxin [Deltaproteobacteria bacterium]|nr:MAG: type II toxin-antitoxin system VapC family toxin [Deltaproteobacteria bacterium]RLB04830.1 MAG: type II toxin-antitoxin system VapC family toxin [Deltaproteobacteria bacterium]